MKTESFTYEIIIPAYLIAWALGFAVYLALALFATTAARKMGVPHHWPIFAAIWAIPFAGALYVLERARRMPKPPLL